MAPPPAPRDATAAARAAPGPPTACRLAANAFDAVELATMMLKPKTREDPVGAADEAAVAASGFASSKSSRRCCLITTTVRDSLEGGTSAAIAANSRSDCRRRRKAAPVPFAAAKSARRELPPPPFNHPPTSASMASLLLLPPPPLTTEVSLNTIVSPPGSKVAQARKTVLAGTLSSAPRAVRRPTATAGLPSPTSDVEFEGASASAKKTAGTPLVVAMSARPAEGAAESLLVLVGERERVGD